MLYNQSFRILSLSLSLLWRESTQISLSSSNNIFKRIFFFHTCYTEVYSSILNRGNFGGCLQLAHNKEAKFTRHTRRLSEIEQRRGSFARLHLLKVKSTFYVWSLNNLYCYVEYSKTWMKALCSPMNQFTLTINSVFFSCTHDRVEAVTHQQWSRVQMLMISVLQWWEGQWNVVD